MPEQLPLVLGGITFEGFEVPEELPIQLSQAIAVHQFPDGVVTVQRYGKFTQPIRFHGMLRGSNAFSRAQSLRALEDRKDLVPLTYGIFNFRGIVEHVTITPHQQFLFTYEIEYRVVTDASNPGQAAGPQSPLYELAQSAQSLRQQATNPPQSFTFQLGIQNDAQDIADAADSISTTSNNDPSAVNPVQKTLLKSGITELREVLAPLIAGTDPSASSAANDLDNVLRKMDALLDAGSPILAVTREVNPNLFKLASLYYGDASKWQLIASANNISDPMPEGDLTLLIPTDYSI